jgi:hypothetical protein
VAKYGPQAAGVNMSGRHGNHASGSRNARWNHGLLFSSHGYILTRVGKGHHRAFGSGYAYEHDLVMEALLGRPLLPGEVVHHKNEDKTDNRHENLELLSASDHMRLHDANRQRDEDGRFLSKPAVASRQEGHGA